MEVRKAYLQSDVYNSLQKTKLIFDCEDNRRDSQEILDKIPTAFFTTKKETKKDWLALDHKCIVKAHGGIEGKALLRRGRWSGETDQNLLSLT